MKEPLLFGILQGLTEFLPVSSSGHLFVLEHITQKIPQWNFSLTSGDFLAFIIYLHLATLLSLLIFFYKPLLTTLKQPQMLLKICYTTAITIVCVLAWTHLLEDLFQKKIFIIIGFTLTALLLFFIRNTGQKDTEALTWKDCLFIGVAQSFAILPGLSRSGITIVALLKRGVNRQDAFTFSFLLAIPTIAAAFVYKLPQLNQINLSHQTLLVSFISALLSGLLALIALKRIVMAGKLHRFGYYCLGLALVLLFI